MRLRPFIWFSFLVLVAGYLWSGNRTGSTRFPLADPDSVRARIDELAGCWVFESRRRHPPLPLRARLDTTRRRRATDRVMRVIVDSSLTGMLSLRYWGVGESGDVAVFVGSEGGLRMRLRPTNDVLWGKAQWASDFGQQIVRPTFRVVGVHIACPPSLLGLAASGRG